MVVYVGKDHKCHVADDGTMTAVEVPFFDGKCDAFIEGYCYEAMGNTTSVYPWKPYAELAAAQRQYEADRAALQAAYEEGVNSAYD